MTQRTEVRFNIHNKTNISPAPNVTMPYNAIDFNVGVGTYYTTTYRYTFSVAGTYFYRGKSY